jgi:hypothetical protein
MKLYLIRAKSNINAMANYDIENKCFTVLKGSTVSESIAHSEKFRGAKSIEKARLGVLDGTKLIQDVLFKSSSTAANFVTGASTNGLTAWKAKDGRTLKEVLAEMEVNNE